LRSEGSDAPAAERARIERLSDPDEAEAAMAEELARVDALLTRGQS
jgi:hypothetical protein